MSFYSYIRGEIGYCYLLFIFKGIYKLYGGIVYKVDF